MILAVCLPPEGSKPLLCHLQQRIPHKKQAFWPSEDQRPRLRSPKHGSWLHEQDQKGQEEEQIAHFFCGRVNPRARLSRTMGSNACEKSVREENKREKSWLVSWLRSGEWIFWSHVVMSDDSAGWEASFTVQIGLTEMSSVSFFLTYTLINQWTNNQTGRAEYFIYQNPYLFWAPSVLTCPDDFSITALWK